MKKPHWGRKAAVTLSLTAAAAVCLGLLSLLFAMKENRWEMLASYFANPLLVLLNLLPPVVLTALLFALTGRAFLAFPLAGAVVMGFTWTNWFKLQFRNDPLLFEDLTLLKEAGDMAGKYRLFLPKGLVVTVLCIALGTAALYFCAQWRPSARTRLATAAAVLVLLLPLRTVYFSNDLYNNRTQNNTHINQWSTTEVYQSKGFVYPFLYSLKMATAPAPDGYHAKTSAERLEGYGDSAIPDGKKVNILAIMLESYCDFTGVENAPALADEVYAPYHALEAEGLSGTLVTNIFAGGTVNSERSFLTGFPTLPAFRGKTNSFVWYLRGQGYRTTGSHPFHDWFYQRDKINQNLGFEDYLYLENHYGALTGGQTAYDDVLFPELARLCAEETAPWFSFSVSYQGHGPYSDSENIWGGEYIVDDGYSASEYHILNNYFGSVANTGRNLAALADELRTWEEPVVLVVFGDHKPWLGDNQAVYDSLGIPIDCETEDGFLCHYSTQYLIWGNDAAKQTLGRELSGEGPSIGPSMLMCCVFDALGWDGPAFMKEQRELMQAGVTMYHAIARNVLFDGRLCDLDELPEDVRAKVQAYLCDAFYERKHFAY